MTVVFAGMLVAARWLDGHRVSDRVAPAVADALAKYGFRLTEVAAEVGIDFLHHAPTLDPKLRNIHAYIGSLGIAARVRESGKAVTTESIEAARPAGASDVEIHDTVLIAAAFCMDKRYVDSLAAGTPTDPALYGQMDEWIVADGDRGPSAG